MIVKMKKAQIAVLSEDREALLEALQRSGVLMLLKSSDDSVQEDGADEEQLAARTEKSLRLLTKYHDKEQKETEADKFPSVPYETFVTDDPAHRVLLEAIEAADETIVRLKADDQSLKNELDMLRPWTDLELATDRVGKNRGVVYHLGIVPVAKQEDVQTIAATIGAALQFYGSAADGIATVAAVILEEDVSSMDALRLAGFLETSLPPAAQTVKETILAKEAQLRENADRIRAAEAQMKDYAGAKLSIELLNDRAVTAAERKKAPVTPTASTVFIEGWVRVDQLDELDKAIASATAIYELELFDPAKGEIPPTAVKNNKFVTAFETITDMFARPSYGEVDPNPVMSFWYWMLFGMMMADFGYGVVMVLLFAFLIKKMHAKGETLKLLKVLMYSGVTTAFWGLLFNSYFGASIGFMDRVSILNPVDDTMLLLGISLGIGVLHIFTGLFMRAVNSFRHKDYMAIFADSFAWILLISGLSMLLVPSIVVFAGGAAVAAAGKWVAIAGAAIIVLFAGRSSKNPVARIGSGLYALYGVTGYLGDIMSYSRVLALALTSAIIGQVMNQLAGMVQGDAWWGILAALPIYLIGHIFNLVMGLLSAYVHTSRLQFIEFYTKFYEGAGYEFRPLAIQLKYIDVVSDAKN
ncbi:MAG TPA: hypothetical protein DCR44_04635 [Acholeplasmatales bacterium]|nr:MAG: hypothetical protein A2Y16_04610 [Tenericutes bacterium GWF2_57_13]HAQ56668.1 hypothetical protein [Acholeplasmatales bacterium]